MIRLLDDMPAGVLGFEAVDDVEKEDYEHVLVPLVDHAGCGPSTTTCDMRCSPPRTVRESCATRRAGGTPG